MFLKCSCRLVFLMAHAHDGPVGLSLSTIFRTSGIMTAGKYANANAWMSCSSYKNTHDGTPIQEVLWILAKTFI